MEIIINYALSILSDINFMMAMLIIVLVSACFLGRYIVITRKMVIATLGVLGFRVIFIIAGDILLKVFNPELYKFMEGLSVLDTVQPDNPYYEAMMTYSFFSSIILNSVWFLYAFIFYLVANKEKRILRALESTIVLYLLYYYINTAVQYSFMYFNGADIEALSAAVSAATGKDTFIYTISAVVTDFVIYLILILVLYFRYFKKKKFYVVRMGSRILFIVWLIIFSIFPAIPVGTVDINQKFQMLSILMGFMIPVLGIIAPIMLVMSMAEKNLREKNEYQETYLKAELEYIERYKRNQEETRAFRHDIINNLSLTNMMLEEGKAEEASEHLKQLLGNVRSLSPSIITGDEMLDCIVAMKADKMKEKGIDFTLDGVADGGLKLKPMDVCSIFANALDNAIEASSKIHSVDGVVPESGDEAEAREGREAEDAWVKMDIKRTEKFFVIKISNAANQQVDVEKLFSSSGYTSKKDKEHHGFGLRNIRMAVEDYDGLVKAESDESSFALSIMIPRK